MTPMHKHAQKGRAVPPIFDDSRGNEPLTYSGEFKIGGSMESLVEIVQIENSLQNYVNFTLRNGFHGIFKH